MEGKYISMISYKKNDEEIATPVWFVEKDGSLYVITEDDSYKVKRLRINTKVKVAISNFRGKPKEKYREGNVRFLSNVELDNMKNMFRKKYFWYRIIDYIWKRAERKGKRKGDILLEIKLN